MEDPANNTTKITTKMPTSLFLSVFEKHAPTILLI